jgi:dTDP-4-amino-4,6-dideoxygalactose transaminase
MNYHIPLTKCCLTEKETENVLQAIASEHIYGEGQFTKKCEEYLQSELNVSKVLLTSSCTDALEMCALLVKIKPGDEVIIPSFTFVSTANAFLLFGAKPVFCDIRQDTFNMDENKLERLISKRTKAIVPVHYAGIGCEMDEIKKIANYYEIPVVEDNAHGLFGKYKGKYLGTFGCLATQSFDRAKNFTCGEGGALIVNDENLVSRAEIIRDKGTNRAAFFRGEISEYTWIDVGSNYFPSELQAGFLYGQLMSREQIQTKRSHIWQYYNKELEEWATFNNVTLPYIPKHCEQSFLQYHILMPSLEARDAIINHLKLKRITGAFHYVPLHLSEMGRRLGNKYGDCPIAENVGKRIVRLPFFYSLDIHELERIITAVKAFVL